ncbi:MAG: YicC family protein [Litoreibacter sp.]|nr:YicC family protein [Litoreibacter sp.]
MTGFSSTTGTQGGYSWILEIRGVNAKGLDLRLRLPEQLAALERPMRAELSAKFSRGNVGLTLRLEHTDTSGRVVIDDGVLDAYLDAAIRVRFKAREKGLKLASSKATDFLGLRGVVASGDATAADIPTDQIMASFREAVEAFGAMRVAEGTALAAVLSEHLDQVAALTTGAVELAEARLGQMADTLAINLARVMDNVDAADPDRVAQELAMLAVKADVTEEVNRLAAHVDAARALLEGDGAIGRKLDFLMQEFNREANTLCSKSGTTDLTRVGLDLKAVIDQMREQVQNVE